MGRGRKIGSKSGSRKPRVRSKEGKRSDESDEDYMVEEDEISDSDVSCFEGDELEDDFDSFQEEEEEVRKIVRSNSRKRDKRGSKKLRKRKRDSCEEDEEDEDYDYDDDDDDDDEFTLEGMDDLEEEEDILVENKNKKKKIKKVGQQGLRKRGSVKSQTRKRKISKKPLGSKGKKNFGSRKKARRDEDDDDDDDYDEDDDDDYDDGDFVDEIPVARQKSNKKHGGRKKRLVIQSDSDFVSSGSSDFEFTISEEEREQIREASKLCRSLTTSLRTSSSSKKNKEDKVVCQQRKPPGRKGKEKVEDEKNEVAHKQVCGICLTEEGQRTVRGTLNCCSHYFCFACIMEWSKVESRCPMCKQRFVTISKPARSHTGIDLRNVVIPIQERDQVYQPSEEEIRGYLNPYENVICTECHQGGDDNLMLLCDLCDSPAHTYCVGLGQEVPEGNWYCEGCRPVALGSTISQAQGFLISQRTTSNNMSHRPSYVGEDLNVTSVPSTPFTQGIGYTPPRYPVGDVQATSAMTGAWASTLSGRRRIHRQIHSLLFSNRDMGSRIDGISASNLGSDYLNTQINPHRETTFQRTRTPEEGTSYHAFFEETVQETPPPVPSRDLLSQFRRDMVQNPVPTATEGYVQSTLWVGVNPRIPGQEQIRECSSRSSIGSENSVSPCTLGEESCFYIQKEQVKSMVKSHLKTLSRGMELVYRTSKEIERKSTHTILAACGLEHRRTEVYPDLKPSICTHIGLMRDAQMSLMKGHCSGCLESFARIVVKTIMNSRLPHFLQVRD